MSEKRQQEQPPEAFNIGDIYFVLFRRKWLILLFCLAGLIGAGVISVLRPAQWQSDARLFIQFVPVVSSKPSEQPGGSGMMAVDPGSGAMNIVMTEMELFKSLDLAEQVVTNIGPERILAKYGGGEDTNKAAAVVLNNLAMDEMPKTPSILHVTMQHPDPEVARDILRSFIMFYQKKSRNMRLLQMSEEQLETEAQQVENEFKEASKALTEAKSQAGVISTYAETAKDLSERYSRTQNDFYEAQAQLSETGASLKATNLTMGTGSGASNAMVNVPNSVVDEYRRKLDQLARARKDLDDVEYQTPELSPLREGPKKRVQTLESSKDALEKQYPALPALVSPMMSAGSSTSPNLFEAAPQILRALQISEKINTLSNQLSEIKNQQTKLESQRAVIVDLESKLNFKETYLKRLREKQEVASNSVNPEFAGGIKISDPPSPSVRKRAKIVKKMMAGSLAIGVLAGLGLAFMLEMVMDRSIRRPGEIETKLRLPLFISIPDLARKGNGNGHHAQLAASNNRKLLNGSNEKALVKSNGANGNAPATELPIWDPQHGLHRFCSGLRDRLIVNFEVRNLTHNPKLVGVTSCNKGAGVSTVAAGLASSLSETGDGNVLLVDMRGEQGAAQQFYKGKPGLGVDEALRSETREGAFVQEKLYVASEAGEAEIPTALSKRFASLMPKLKASDYDYIIFDMPPVSQTSITARLSGLMDMVLLVIESEKTQRDSVKRATALLNESKAHISTVLNKVHNYVPTRLHQEYLDDEA